MNSTQTRRSNKTRKAPKMFESALVSSGPDFDKPTLGQAMK